MRDIHKRAAPIWLVLALVAAALLRFVALEQKPLWCDELATLQRLSLTFPQHVRAMSGNHPLYELLLRFWMPPDGSDAWMRIPSAAFGVAAVGLAWMLMRAAGGREATFAAWFVALSPLLLMHSRIARAYSLACALAFLSNLALLGALRRRTTLSFLAYVAATALMIYANLLAAGIWLAQALFILWFLRRRLRRLLPWAAAHAGVGALLAPWLVYSLPGAIQFGAETTYTAQQVGRAAKVCYLAFTLCLGETVHPLNFWVVPAGFLGFGAVMAAGTIYIVRRRRAFGLLLLTQVAVLYSAAIMFPAAAPKHLTVLLPAWCGVLAIGLLRWNARKAASAAGIILVATMCVSLVNYFAGREFHDADMVTPWREMAAAVKGSEGPRDTLVVGYRMDHGAYDMFRRYYRGTLKAEYLDFQDWRGHLDGAIKREGAVWLLLHDGDPWLDVESWLKGKGLRFSFTPFQEEEHTLRGLREEGFRGVGKYRSPLYRLYRIERFVGRGTILPPLM